MKAFDLNKCTFPQKPFKLSQNSHYSLYTEEATEAEKISSPAPQSVVKTPIGLGIKIWLNLLKNLKSEVASNYYPPSKVQLKMK